MRNKYAWGGGLYEPRTCRLFVTHGDDDADQAPGGDLRENVSFDHYFGTYPHATNTDGPTFHAHPGTPKVNGLEQDGLLTRNPNHFDDGSTANPQRLGRQQAVTCDQGHGYGDEQLAYDGGKMDLFVQHTDRETCDSRMFSEPGLVMDYYDGNTTTALWNYARRFAMSDNS